MPLQAHSDGYSPLHCAATASSNARELTEMLLRYGANRHATDRGGRSVAELAVLSGHPGALADLLSIDKDTAASAARSAKTLMHTLQHAATNAATGLSHLLPSPRGGGRTATPRDGAMSAMSAMSAMTPFGQLPGVASVKERARVDPKEGQAHCGSSLAPPSGMGELWGRAFGHAKEESRRRASSVASLLSRRSSSQSVGTWGGDSARQRSADDLPTGGGGGNGGGAAVRPAEEQGGGAQPDSEPPTSERMGNAATPGVDGSGTALEVRGVPESTQDADEEGPGVAHIYV